MEPFSLLFLAVGVYLLFMMFSRTRKQQREVQQTQAGLVPGAEVMTTAGLYATVVELGDDYVVLETAPGQESRWDRRAIARILAASTFEDDDEEDLDDEDDLDGGEGPDANGEYDVEDDRSAGADDDKGEGAGARLEHDSADGGRTRTAGSAPSGKDTTPPDRA